MGFATRRCASADAFDERTAPRRFTQHPRTTLVARGAATSTRERGASLVGLLLVLIILGVMAAAAVSAVGGSSDTAVLDGHGATTTSLGESPHTAAQATLSVACVADFQTLTVELRVFATL